MIEVLITLAWLFLPCTHILKCHPVPHKYMQLFPVKNVFKRILAK
jgi:hypothetical protein